MSSERLVTSGVDGSGTRLSADEGSAAIRQQRARAARGNLAAMVFEAHGVDIAAEAHYPGPPSLLAKTAARDFEELADALGLRGKP